MFFYLIRRILYAIPIALAVGFVCFMLVQIAPGDPINAIVPADAPGDVVEQVRARLRARQAAAGAVRPLAAEGGAGRSRAVARHRAQVWSDLSSAIANTLMLALVASCIGFVLGCMLGGLAGHLPRLAASTARRWASRSPASRCRTTGSAWCWW